MSDVTRYDDGACACCQGCGGETVHESRNGDYVTHADYAALEAENARLREELAARPALDVESVRVVTLYARSKAHLTTPESEHSIEDRCVRILGTLPRLRAALDAKEKAQ